MRAPDYMRREYPFIAKQAAEGFADRQRKHARAYCVAPCEHEIVVVRRTEVAGFVVRIGVAGREVGCNGFTGIASREYVKYLEAQSIERIRGLWTAQPRPQLYSREYPFCTTDSAWEFVGKVQRHVRLSCHDVYSTAHCRVRPRRGLAGWFVTITVFGESLRAKTVLDRASRVYTAHLDRSQNQYSGSIVAGTRRPGNAGLTPAVSPSPGRRGEWWSWVRFLIPRALREGFFGDLCEDVAEMKKAGAAAWKVAAIVGWQLAFGLLLWAATWKTALWEWVGTVLRKWFPS